MQLCTFFLNGVYFGIDVLKVQEVIRYPEITSVPLAPVDICGLINLRGQIITVVDLKRRLEMAENDTDRTSDEKLNFNIVLDTNSELVSLLVDDVGDVVEVDDSNFESTPATLKGKIRHLVEGTYKFADSFLLVLDTEKILTNKNYG